MTLLLVLALATSGCSGEPSDREIQNARAFEALLTAVSLKNEPEFKKDIERIDERHAAGELSEGNYQEIQKIVQKGRAKDWEGASKQAYEFRARFGDGGSYFK